ncbi:Pvc16 family protein [uncultured Psychroserpens sp.]|uniref:Pvc16 family protein n=1 Tax=uncultured Psychroserpens sp. TaxID=255436 RepID=UPI00260C4B6E|nr:Pvc16 family protein [uncultured Psychroserpens sp.]
MLLDTLRFIHLTLDTALKHTFKSRDAMISIAGVTSTTSKTPLRLSLVNIDAEHTQHVAISRQRSGSSTPTHKKLFVLISANPELSYDEGIRYLEEAMAWFESHEVFSQQTYVNLPKHIERITTEAYSQTLEGQSVLWQGLGAAYQPSVVYQLRVVVAADIGVTPAVSIEGDREVME